MSRAPAGATPGGWPIRDVGAVGSTNEEAKHLATAGCPDRTVVWASEQTSGRGRHGRTWVSPPGNLYASCILEVGRSPAERPQVGLVAALAIVDTVSGILPETIPTLALKWPNDVLVGGSKVSGILVENIDGNENRVILGMGINVVSHPDAVDRPSTALNRVGYKGTIEELLHTLLRHLAVRLDEWEAEGFVGIRKGWLHWAAIGQRITVRLGAEVLSGRFAGLDDNGGLVLTHGDGSRVLTAGEVFENAG